MDEPGNPNELKQALRNWLEQARSPIGSLPDGVDPVDWAVDQFIKYWERPVRRGLANLEESLNKARDLCDAKASCEAIRDEIDYAFQIIGEDVRPELGLYDWNDDSA